MYRTSFSINNKMLNLSISITEKIGRIEVFKSLKRMPTLRRNNRIRSVHSSLVIETNSLSFEEVRDVVAVNAVISPKKEIHTNNDSDKRNSILYRA